MAATISGAIMEATTAATIRVVRLGMTWTELICERSPLSSVCLQLSRIESACELNSGEKIPGEFVAAYGDCAKILEFVEEAFNEIALAVERKVAIPRGLAIGFWGNHRGDLSLCKSVEQHIRIISVVAERSLWIGPFEQQLCASPIMGLRGREHQIPTVSKCRSRLQPARP